MGWPTMKLTSRSLITWTIPICVALATSACIEPPPPPSTSDNKQSDDEDMSAPDAALAGISILLDGDEVGSAHTATRGSTQVLSFKLLDENGALVETPPPDLEIEIVDVHDSGEQENQPLERAAFLALLEEDKVTFEEFGRVKLTARVQGIADSVFIDVVDDAPTFEDFEPLTLLREGDTIDLYETLSFENDGFSLLVVRECNSEGELSASGAIALENGLNGATLTAARAGYGELVLGCDALAEYGLPTARTYRFHVEPATQLSSGQEHTCGLLRDNLSAGGESKASVYCWGLNDRGQVAKLGGQDRLSPEVVLRDALDVTTGPMHSCAITSAGERKGKLECWGDNTLGQSNPEMTTSSTLKLPSELAYEYASFIKTCASAEFSCGLTDSGRLLCWGLNSAGALGPDVELGAITPAPIEVARGEKFYEVGCGRAHICATGFDGQTACWGDNSNKQLGSIDAPASSPLPIPVTISGNTLDFETLELQGDTSCGVLEDGSLLCWGDNSSRRLTSQHIEAMIPEPSVITLPAPQGAAATTAVDSVALGDRHACTITRDGRLLCWGQNTWGQLGVGDFEPRYEDPELIIPPASDPRSVSVGAMHTCAMLRAQSQGEQDKLNCWGRSDNGKLGDGSSHIVAPSAAPTVSTFATDATRLAISNIPHARALVSGSHHNCVFADPSEDTTTFDRLYCWGSDALGQRGRLLDLTDSSKGETSSPDELPPTLRDVGGLDLISMSAGDSHTCALNTSLPVPPLPSSGCGGDVMQQGYGYSTIHCWGFNSHQQAGPPSFAGTASPFTTINPGPTSCVEDFANTLPPRLGSMHSCGFYLPERSETPGFDPEPHGPAFCWGNGNFGQHGTGDELFSDSSPGPSIPVITGSSFSGMTSYGSLNYAWRNAFSSGFGKLYAWGHDPRGLIKDWGDTPVSERIIWTAERVPEWNKSGDSLREQAKSIEHLAPGLDHICAVTNKQTNYVVCWGSNEHGQLGIPEADYSRADEYKIVQVDGQELTGAVQLVSGEAHTCALLSDNRLYCWGKNDRGQVGAVTNGSVSSNAHVVREPTLIRAFSDAELEILEISAGKEHTCARVQPQGATSGDGDLITIHCWGANDQGQSSWPIETEASRCQNRGDEKSPRWSREATPCEVWPR